MNPKPPPNINGIAVEYRHEATLTMQEQNARPSTTAHVDRMARSIVDFGWTNPIVVDESGLVLAGRVRLQAARKLGIEMVPTICIKYMTLAQKRAYIIADNRLTEIGGTWDRKLLALEHEAIRLLDPQFDITATGFELDDINVMFDSLSGVGEDKPVEVDLTRPAVSRLGDLWLLGEHRLYCGDAKDPASFGALLGTEKAQLVIADSPYNVKIGGHCVGKGKHREFFEASGEMTRSEFVLFLTTVFANLIVFSENGSIHYLFMDWRHMMEMVLATASQYTEQKNLICWDKVTAGLGTFYRSQMELIWVMKNGEAKHINNFGLGEKGRHRSNVWSYQGMAGVGAPDRNKLLALHPTVKPLALIMDAIKDCSRKGGLVLDCFSGSGTTLIAAEQTGRRAAVMEIDPHYVDVAIRRWEDDTGKKAVLGDTGRTFDEIEKERG